MSNELSEELIQVIRKLDNGSSIHFDFIDLEFEERVPLHLGFSAFPESSK